MNWKDKVVLRTGGTGSFGKKFASGCDELKQHEMQVGGYRHDRRYYSSDNNSKWLDVEDIKKITAPFEELFVHGKLEG